MQDQIVEETHRIRREIAAQFNGDVHAFFEYLRERESERSDEVVTLQPVAPDGSGPKDSRTTAEA